MISSSNKGIANWKYIYIVVLFATVKSYITCVIGVLIKFYELFIKYMCVCVCTLLNSKYLSFSTQI